MVGLIVAAHGYLAEALMHSCELIAGTYQNAVTLALEKDDDADLLKIQIEAGIEKVDQGDGVVIFTDLLGGTPSNLATLTARKSNLYCLTGVNLPMILEFVMDAEDNVPLEALMEQCLEAAAGGVKFTSKARDVVR